MEELADFLCGMSDVTYYGAGFEGFFVEFREDVKTTWCGVFVWG
jgi:hypothetical protein